jgi:hypothetical protein
MTDTDAKQLILDIITQAKENRAIDFHYIKSWHEFRYYSKLNRSTKLIVKTLRDSANNLFKDYCKDVISGISDVNKLLAYSQLQDIILFYKRDLDTLKQMLDEYDEYLGQYFWESFFGGEREI